EDLVTEADAEDARAAEQVAHRLDFALQWSGIAGAWGEEHAVVGGELVRADVVRMHGDRSACGRKAAEHRLLHAVVDDGDAHAAVRGENVRLVGRHPGGERATLHRRQRTRGLDGFLDRAASRDRDGAHRAEVADLQHEGAGVDARERDDAALVQPVGPLGTASLAHEDRLRVHAPRLRARLGDAVVADHRRREADDLLREARIGDGLLVAAHTGGEHGLSGGEALRGDRLAAEDRSVLECEKARHASNATAPPAIVIATAPTSRSPSSQLLRESERKPCASTSHSRSRSRSTRLAGAPTATRGRSRPNTRAGPADMRSSNVASGRSPGCTSRVYRIENAVSSPVTP